MPLAIFVLISSAALADEGEAFPDGEQESKVSEPELVKDRAFLWGLAGFLLTSIPGAIGLGFGAQGVTDILQDATPLNYAAGGAAIGAGVSLVAALIRTGNPAVYSSLGFKYLKSAFYGDLIGFGVITLAAIAMYPEILQYALAVVALLILEGIFGPQESWGCSSWGFISLGTLHNRDAVFLHISIPLPKS